ncbi:MAG TPA: hypothetical protein VMG38_11870 [Trebonia sp.]|nr:hypothetical protein [Trebonia sp.]
MSELRHGSETTEPEGTLDRPAGDSRGFDRDLDVLSVEDQLPPRQGAHAAALSDDPQYDEADLGAEYDGDLAALTGEDHIGDTVEGNAPALGEGDSPVQPHITHYQANFRGEQLDLWTDGEGRWASDYKRDDDALPVDHLADARSRMGPEAMPATEWADGHEIAVTRDPKDGVWIPGLPGEVPDEAGDVDTRPEGPRLAYKRKGRIRPCQ